MELRRRRIFRMTKQEWVQTVGDMCVTVMFLLIVKAIINEHSHLRLIATHAHAIPTSWAMPEWMWKLYLWIAKVTGHTGVVV